MSAALSAFFTVRTWSTLDLSAVFMFCYGIISIRDYKYNQTTYPPSLYWPYSSRSRQSSWPSAQEWSARLAATSTSKFQNLFNQRPNPKIWCDSANLDHGALPFPSDRRRGLSTEPDVVPERWISLSFQKSLLTHDYNTWRCGLSSTQYHTFQAGGWTLSLWKKKSKVLISFLVPS